MSDIDTVIFVNGVTGRGALNNVINLQLGVFLFNATEDGRGVETTLTTNCRLRMDRMCAQQLQETLTELLKAISEQEQISAVAEVATDTRRPN